MKVFPCVQKVIYYVFAWKVNNLYCIFNYKNNNAWSKYWTCVLLTTELRSSKPLWYASILELIHQVKQSFLNNVQKIIFCNAWACTYVISSYQICHYFLHVLMQLCIFLLFLLSVSLFLLYLRIFRQFKNLFLGYTLDILCYCYWVNEILRG